MVTTKITIQLDPHDLKIINEALLLLVARMEDVKTDPKTYADPMLDEGQLQMFSNDASMKSNDARAILNAIN
jgi:hypothetical protein